MFSALGPDRRAALIRATSASTRPVFRSRKLSGRSLAWVKSVRSDLEATAPAEAGD